MLLTKRRLTRVNHKSNGAKIAANRQRRKKCIGEWFQVLLLIICIDLFSPLVFTEFLISLDFSPIWRLSETTLMLLMSAGTGPFPLCVIIHLTQGQQFSVHVEQNEKSWKLQSNSFS